MLRLGTAGCRIEARHRSREKQAIDKFEETSVELGCSFPAAAAVAAVDYFAVAEM